MNGIQVDMNHLKKGEVSLGTSIAINTVWQFLSRMG
ncbi:hypothetical protein ZYGR_0AG04280 [Zygosaccharomyces rouxii]|uniref:Uncharacterized protein n=1 Tax=Zygosaccharomyces rouxii TaxID=4956 RepID=A0A1Q3A9Q8_ZYGRO|nr:hypothetical protein ZYGR_0AG04280 [Zygosaccharomyces rouxii]